MAQDALIQTIETNLANPLEAEVDGVRSRQHNLKDQLAVRDASLASSAFETSPPTKVGFRVARFTPPGPTD